MILKQKISILGCGWLGLDLALNLINNGYNVKGSATSRSSFENLKIKAIPAFIVDIKQRERVVSDFLSSDVLIISITSKSIDDFKRLITQIEKSNIKKVIFISSTSVYPNTNNITTEETPIKTSSLTEIESLFRKNKLFQSTIIRFGGLFGYDRQPGNFFKKDKKIENPEGYINFIHRDDCIQIIKNVIKSNTWNQTLNACADSHPKRRDFYKNEFKKLGKPEPMFNEESLNDYKIVTSEKLKNLLNYTFKYPDLMNY
ncbi:MAG: nucleoside-diphosphate-sugar epimerase [Flavobacteriales bacterium]|jgi:nucleoside-diphosphate-sugar epimerase|tara:strand:- start:853 stop:1626 length:774 start_codon:yes stop_codon:yes gene_type:complete